MYAPECIVHSNLPISTPSQAIWQLSTPYRPPISLLGALIWNVYRQVSLQKRFSSKSIDASRMSLSARPIFLRLLRTFEQEILCNVCAFWPSTVVDRYWYARSVLGEACRASRISTLPWETANQNLWPIPLRLRSYCSRLMPLISNPN